MLKRETLDPKQKLVAAVVDWLAAKIRVSPEGTKSLRHLMVVVPTAQSGRNLRLSLARKFGALIPPKIVQPVHLARPQDRTIPEATEEELAAAFLRFLPEIESGKFRHVFASGTLEDAEGQLDLLEQLNDIWRILAGRGILMGEVINDPKARAVLEAAAGEELTRWEELGALEQEFFQFLHARNLRHPAETIHLANLEPEPIPDDVEEVVLPSLVDPIRVMLKVLARQREDLTISVLVHSLQPAKFDEWGIPKVAEFTGRARPRIESLTEEDIIVASNSSNLSEMAAKDFVRSGTGDALPVLSVADESLLPEISAAFLNEGFEVRHSGRHQLSKSALGRLMGLMFAIYASGPESIDWKVLAALMRLGDVQEWLKASHELKREAILAGLDEYRNARLPVAVTREDMEKSLNQPKLAGFAQATLKWFELMDQAPEDLAGFVRFLLSSIFEARALVGSEGEKEFREALTAANGLLAKMSSDGVLAAKLSRRQLALVAQKSLKKANYMLESDSPDAVQTEGWLELPWSLGERFMLAGLHEGAVPDSVLGHPFVPDSLRVALGLVSNEQRLARDSWILEELAESHPAHAIKAYIAKTTLAGDICRPSRLLMLCDEAELPRRAEYLFGDVAETYSSAPRMVADAWRLKLPDELELDRLSASAIDTYLNCPFAFLLNVGLKMRKYEDKFELDEAGFGSVVHEALERYAQEELSRERKGLPPLTEVKEIREKLHEIVEKLDIAQSPSGAVKIQLASIRGRLDNFALVQSQWARAGWRVAGAELKFRARPFKAAGLEMEIKGFVDRLDYHPEKKLYRIIDYKTWDEKSDINSHIFSSVRDPKKSQHLAFAERLKLPVLDGKTRLLSIQLPLYAHSLRVAWPERFGSARFDYCYLVLGESLADTVVYGSCEDQGDFEAQKRGKKVLAELETDAIATSIAAIRRIKSNIFWPPGPGQVWQYDLKDLLVDDPEKDLSNPDGTPGRWLKAQLDKLSQLEGGAGDA